MVSFWWNSLDQTTVSALLGVAVISWVVRVVSRRVNPDKAMLDRSVLLDYVLVRSIVGAIEVLR